MDFTVRQLLALEAVTRHGHFGRAADDLGLAQPTLSAEIRTLERRLGLTLLHRASTGITPTPEGAELLPLAQRIVQDCHVLQRRAQRLRERPGTVRLAASPSLINRLVPRLLHDLAARDGSPLAIDLNDIEVVEVDTGQVLSAVQEGNADLGLGHWVTAVQGVRTANIGYDPLHVIAARGSLVSQQPTSLRNFAEHSLLIWPREQAPEYFDAILEVCHQHGIDPAITALESRVSGAQSYLLHSGQTFCLVPCDFATESPGSIASAPLDPPAGVPLNAVWREPGSGAVTQLIARLRHLHQIT